MLNLSLKDVQSVGPWAALASGILLVQNYQSLLTRLGNIALLFCWNMYISRDNNFVYRQVLFELFRSTKAKGRGIDHVSKHWTRNIADTLVLAACGYVASCLFPDHYWPSAALGAFVSLFVLGHNVVQLWMQTQIARLVRLNANVWRWRDWVIDNTALSLMQKIDSSVTTAVKEICWWIGPYISTGLASKLFRNFMLSCLILPTLDPSSPAARSRAKWSLSIIFCQVWFHDLGKFANPDPPEHKYIPLKDPEDIRVVLLYPRFGFGKVCCSLLQGPHMRTLIYEAISYNWGSMDATEEILVDGCRKKVTRSVHEILTSYSSLFLPKLLWIDALCIDQNNDAEKSQQVPLMEQIYRSAIFTTVFLGQSPLRNATGTFASCLMPYRYDGLYSNDKNTQTHFKDAQLAFDLLEEFYILKSDVLNDRDMRAYQLFESLKLSKSKQRQWAALLKMLQHPWFERVWVIQEVALSAEVRVIYGDDVMDWDTLSDGIETLNRARHFRLWLEVEHGVQFSHIQRSSLYNIARMNQFRDKYRPRGSNDYSSCSRETFSLSKVLAQSSYFKATNPRDLVFGLMSLCANPLKVDYALSVEDIFLKAAKRLIDDDAIPLLLHTSGAGNRPESPPVALNMPSWVPNWTATPRYERLQAQVKYSLSLSEFKAGGERKPAISLRSNKTLAISGYRVDVIAELGPALFDTTHQDGRGIVDEMHHLAASYQASADLLEKSSHISDPYPHAKTSPSLCNATASQSVSEAFYRTLFLDTTHLAWNMSLLEGFQLFLNWKENHKIFRNRNFAQLMLAARKNEFYELLKSMDQVTEKIRSCCGGRRFFITRRGYIGMCPPYSQQGDLIYVVPGLHVPIMLRPGTTSLENSSMPGATNRLKLVGECYAHGIMNGEALTMGFARAKLEII